MMEHLDVLLAVATEVEGARLLSAIERAGRTGEASRGLVVGDIFGRRVGLVRTGVGKVNTGLSLGAAFSSLRPELLLSVGVGGAYPGSGLRPGEVAVATEEIYGDEGVETEIGFQGMEEIGLPLWSAEGTSYFNRFPADTAVRRDLEAAAARVGRFRAGPFVTVSTVTGTARRAAFLEKRYAAVCENMEGAAAAHAAVVSGTPFVEVRGISNAVGPRDRAGWRLEEAAEVAQRVALTFLEARFGSGGPDGRPGGVA